jgi:hypothetical protein
MRPVVLHHLMIALLACLASISVVLHPSSSTSLFRKSPSITSIGSQLLPSFSTTSRDNVSPSPSRSTVSINNKENNHKDNNTNSSSTMAYKMCTLIFEIFSALCLTSHGGYDTVMLVISEVKEEQYRFERLVQGLHDLLYTAPQQQTAVSKLSMLIEEQQELLVFDCVAAALGLFNAIVQTPQTIEKRDALRTELERRGLEEFINSRRLNVNSSPLPDSLQKQLDSYFKQKKSDQDKIRALESTKRQSILQL